MILDEIIAFIAVLFRPAVAIVALPFVLLINGVLALVEFILSFFFDGIELRRVSSKKKDRSARSTFFGSRCSLILVAGLIAMLWLWPKLTKREVTILVDDGYPVVIALMEYKKGDFTEQLRTDKVGTVRVPRFGLETLRIKDPRYVSKAWSSQDLEGELIVQRTVLGSGLDKMKDFLLKPAANNE